MNREKTFAHLKRLQSVLALALMVLALTLSTDSFLTVGNGLLVLQQICVNLCLSIGMTIVIISGGIDLSVGSVLAFSGAVAAGSLKNGFGIPGTDVLIIANTPGAILVGLVVGMALGWFNGFGITRFKLPPFVATLGMLGMARGFTNLWTGGYPIGQLGADFGYIGSGSPLGVPMPVWITAALVVIFIVVMKRTRFGRHVYAVGGNERAARLSGLNVGRIKLVVYSLAGVMAGVAGLIQTARIDTAAPNAGISYELDSIAAVVIGGASLNGGRGTIFGTVLGCLIIGVLNNGLVLLEVTPFSRDVVKGAVILVAVAIDMANSKPGRS